MAIGEDPSGAAWTVTGEKGIQRAVHGEGWHFVLPIVYSTELEKNINVPAGQVGIVTARGGKPLPEGRLLAEDGEQGIQRRVVPPGTYRINGYGFDVELVAATEIKPGYVGVQRRLLGRDSKGRFAESDEEKEICARCSNRACTTSTPRNSKSCRPRVRSITPERFTH